MKIVLLLSTLFSFSALAKPPILAKPSEFKSKWLTLECHNEHSRFRIGFSGLNIGDVSQIYVDHLLGKLNDAAKTDAESEEPSIALAKREIYDFEILLRYETGLMWPNDIFIKMTYYPNGYKTNIIVEGDEGYYLNEESTYQCQIQDYRQTLLETSGFQKLEKN